MPTVAHPGEVSLYQNQGLPDIWTSKVSPSSGADQFTQTLQAILDQPR